MSRRAGAGKRSGSASQSWNGSSALIAASPSRSSSKPKSRRREQADDLERARLGRHRRPVGVGQLHRIGVAVVGGGEPELSLRILVFPGKRRVREAATVPGRRRAQRVAVVVDGEHHVVGDPRVRPLLAVHWVQRALVVRGDALAGVGQEDGVVVLRAVRPPLGGGLQQLDRVVVLGDGVGPVLRLAAVERVDLLAQRRALQRPAGLAGFGRGQPPGPGLSAGRPQRSGQCRCRAGPGRRRPAGGSTRSRTAG